MEDKKILPAHTKWFKLILFLFVLFGLYFEILRPILLSRECDKEMESQLLNQMANRSPGDDFWNGEPVSDPMVNKTDCLKDKGL